MSFKSFFEYPDDYPNSTYYRQGGSPKILKAIIRTIEDNIENIKEVNLCWYLFNNNVLHNYLKHISKKGIKVNVITIPLEGYDNKFAQQLTDIETNYTTPTKFTKYDLALEIFKDIYHNNYPNYNIYFYNHIYVRSKYLKKFSKGDLPYSLHIKNGYIKKKDDYISLWSSSNLAVRDQIKYESLLVIENEPGYEDSTQQFFNDIIINSIHIKNFSKDLNIPKNKFGYLNSPSTSTNYYTAPFYFDSANNMEEVLVKHIRKAEKEIIVCAQHLSAFDYTFFSEFHSKIDLPYNTKPGILRAISEMSYKGVNITYLSQTFSSNNEERDKQFRTPVNKNNYINFYNHIKNTPSTAYYVNEKIHSKYIIIDDILIFCTFNFTPTQFIYLDQVKIDSFKNMPDKSFDGIHCEVSSHVVINDSSTLKAFRENVFKLKNHPETKKVL